MKTMMNPRFMTVSNAELIVASYAINRSNNPAYGVLQASKANELVNALRKGMVHGFFTKKDGSIREFWGTTNASLAAKKTVHEIGYAPRLSLGIIPFIDCETGDWRSLRIDNLISFEA